MLVRGSMSEDKHRKLHTLRRHTRVNKMGGSLPSAWHCWRRLRRHRLGECIAPLYSPPPPLIHTHTWAFSLALEAAPKTHSDTVWTVWGKALAAAALRQKRGMSRQRTEGGRSGD